MKRFLIVVVALVMVMGIGIGERIGGKQLERGYQEMQRVLISG